MIQTNKEYHAGVNFIKLLLVQFTSVAVVLRL